jgi:hypothetical protein
MWLRMAASAAAGWQVIVRITAPSSSWIAADTMWAQLQPEYVNVDVEAGQRLGDE